MGAGDLYIYSADKVVLSIAAISIDSGYADGSFVKIERDNDGRFIVHKGTDGSITRSKALDKLHKVSIKLSRSSAANDKLSALINLDDAADNGAGVGPFLLQDLSGRALFAGARGWVHKDPDVELDREQTDSEWIIMVADLRRFDGGNFQV
jgi:hypothetical protein